MSGNPEFLQGTLELLILRSLGTEAQHGWSIAQHIQAVSRDALRVNQGSLYPALHRMEHKGWVTSHWGISEAGRRARIYSLTRAGRRQLERETASWRRFASAMERVLAGATS